MDYAKFCQLVRGGETAQVDFKIDCGAFLGGQDAARAELAKDVCAMANNGNMASYLIVGVSNNGTQFKSVSNKKLTDDNLQDFCKKAISPPPQVKLTWQSWPNAAPNHAGKQFVVIQVGPQKRQAFRLAQDFINHKEEVCYRRNEVWIRRGATSDLATPEEICRLAAGHSALVGEQDEARREERAAFALKAQYERTSALATVAPSLLQGLGYSPLHEADWFELDDEERRPIADLFFDWPRSYLTDRWHYHQKHLGTRPLQAFMWRDRRILLCTLLWYPAQSLTVKDLRILEENLDWSVVDRQRLAKLPAQKRGQRIAAVRRISLIPVVGPVLQSRIAKAIPSLSRCEANLHFYRKGLKSSRWSQNQPSAVPSSYELLILDKIESVSDFQEQLPRVLAEAVREIAPIITLAAPEPLAPQ